MRTYELKLSSAPDDRADHVIEFDGGTSCNIPAKGYGDGYGSYLIDCGKISRVKFGRGHSCNSAEILTLSTALEDLAQFIRNCDKEPLDFTVLARGDSRIALKWVNCRHTPKLTTSENFRIAIERLREIVPMFKKVTTEWRGREHSVSLFGH